MADPRKQPANPIPRALQIALAEVSVVPEPKQKPAKRNRKWLIIGSVTVAYVVLCLFYPWLWLVFVVGGLLVYLVKNYEKPRPGDGLRLVVFMVGLLLFWIWLNGGIVVVGVHR